MSSLHGKLEQYLDVRRAMGFKMERHEKLLGQFTCFLAENGETAITIENALAWATLPAVTRPRWHALRLSAVRGFASWLNAADPVHQVPPRRLIPYGSRAVAPYLYPNEEIEALAREAGRLPGRLRAATFQALIRLLAVTEGMRVGEAIRLDRSDYDAVSGALTVRGAKFGKSRHLPLHPTAITGLNKYLALCGELMPVPQAPALLLTARGCRLRYERTWETFRGLTVSAGLKPRSPACRPRIHDLRH